VGSWIEKRTAPQDSPDREEGIHLMGLRSPFGSLRRPIQSASLRLAAERSLSIVCPPPHLPSPGPASARSPRSPSQEPLRGSPLLRLRRGLPQGAARDGSPMRYPRTGPRPSERADWEARCAYDQGWQRKLYDAGYAGINWPKQYGGRDASLTEQLVYFEETTRARAPYVGVNFVGPPARRPDDHGRGHARAEGAPHRADHPRRADLVSGLLGAGRGIGPRVAQDARGARRRPLRRERSQDLDLRSRRSRTTASCSCAPRPRRSTAASPGSRCR
jgi:hypothetical protein